MKENIKKERKKSCKKNDNKNQKEKKMQIRKRKKARHYFLFLLSTWENKALTGSLREKWLKMI